METIDLISDKMTFASLFDNSNDFEIASASSNEANSPLFCEIHVFNALILSGKGFKSNADFLGDHPHY